MSSSSIPSRPAGLLVSLILLLSLATPAGSKAFVGMSMWGGKVIGRVIVHSLPRVPVLSRPTPSTHLKGKHS